MIVLRRCSTTRKDSFVFSFASMLKVSVLLCLFILISPSSVQPFHEYVFAQQCRTNDGAGFWTWEVFGNLSCSRCIGQSLIGNQQVCACDRVVHPILPSSLLSPETNSSASRPYFLSNMVMTPTAPIRHSEHRALCLASWQVCIYFWVATIGLWENKAKPIKVQLLKPC